MSTIQTLHRAARNITAGDIIGLLAICAAALAVLYMPEIMEAIDIASIDPLCFTDNGDIDAELLGIDCSALSN